MCWKTLLTTDIQSSTMQVVIINIFCRVCEGKNSGRHPHHHSFSKCWNGLLAEVLCRIFRTHHCNLKGPEYILLGSSNCWCGKAVVKGQHITPEHLELELLSANCRFWIFYLPKMMNFMKMRTFYKKLPLFMKNSILHTYKNLKPQNELL